MIYREEIINLFMVPDDYFLVHCISADFALGRGIAVEFNKRFNIKASLQRQYRAGSEPGYERTLLSETDAGDDVERPDKDERNMPSG